LLGPEELESLWSDLGGEDAARACEAIRALEARPGQAVPLLRQRLRPLAEWPPRELARWVADLDADDFGVRERATAGLERWGRWAEPSLRAALAGRPSPEARRWLERLREQAGDGEGPVPTPEALRALRALEVLEQARTPEARRALEVLAGEKAHPWLRAEAAASLARLRQRFATTPACQTSTEGRPTR
jgi:hypothetical protein